MIMKKKTITDLVLENIVLLIPLIIYGIYKNGYLIYEKELINIFSIFKPLYLLLISIGVKIVFDLIKYKKIKIDYNLLYVILLSMIMPYNISYIIYIITFIITYFLLDILDKYLTIHKVCFMYLIIILVSFLINDFTYLNPLEEEYLYSFSFIDYLFGRNIGGLSSTSIIFSLASYLFLINSYYYKKDIPLFINISYLILSIIYYLISKDNSLIINSEMIFASIFISPLPMYSPTRKVMEIIYGILIGILTFIISVTFNRVLAIYLSTFIVSLIYLLGSRHSLTKK